MTVISMGTWPIAAAIALGAAVTATAHDIDMTRLPLGDGRISKAPKAGWIWACRVDPTGGGAHAVGPWIDETAKTWDATRKVVVRGSVTWPHRFGITLRGDRRVIASADLPDHPTGTYPIARTDPAYRYDRNPNRIRSQDIRFELPAMPTLAAAPSCAPPAVGILLTGVLVFNALDLPGRDAVAHETQDACQGHPQEQGAYHYHSLTTCLPDKREANAHSALVGYAFDGFGIFGMYGESEQPLTSSDLDGCHGHTHAIPWDGKTAAMYHYHATPDFPYTVGCMRGNFDQSMLRAILGPPPTRRGPPPGGPGGPPPIGAPPR